MKTDLDLPEAHRTQANLWKAKFFEMREAVQQANKGIRRLKNRSCPHCGCKPLDVKEGQS